ncbi:phospholipase [Burkholderia aenigmatica]|uniref:Phospholipase n=1 Tax=Burkholderia aenigmatica TaxID=2015348 RepID=A0ABY6Y7H4_9BURK|nr:MULTISPECIES: DISARM system phospholipase D-like protein DrmC [Burkholderia]VWD49828.1 phospholipase [Burkholderia aenigmatica]
MELGLSGYIQTIVRRAPSAWLKDVCTALRSSPVTATAEVIKKRMPSTGNADLAFLLHEVIGAAVGGVSWEALGYGLQSAFDAYIYDRAARQIEMLWSGPPPADHLPARRIDQALYDLIANAQHEILLVTFAAVKVDRLAIALVDAKKRGVRIRLVLEFAEASEGQLRFDALKAFPPALVDASEVYFWPVENRDRNQAGKPGKLHAKLAVIDGVVLVSSANLTDDAFTRNLEVGAKLTDPNVAEWARCHFDGLIRDFTLRRVDS